MSELLQTCVTLGILSGLGLCLGAGLGVLAGTALSAVGVDLFGFCAGWGAGLGAAFGGTYGLLWIGLDL